MSPSPSLPRLLSSRPWHTLRPKTCTDCSGPLAGIAASMNTRSSPCGAATGKGKVGAASADFQGLRRRFERCFTTEESFAVDVETQPGTTPSRGVGLSWRAEGTERRGLGRVLGPHLQRSAAGCLSIVFPRAWSFWPIRRQSCFKILSFGPPPGLFSAPPPGRLPPTLTPPSRIPIRIFLTPLH